MHHQFELTVSDDPLLAALSCELLASHLRDERDAYAAHAAQASGGEVVVAAHVAELIGQLADAVQAAEQRAGRQHFADRADALAEAERVLA